MKLWTGALVIGASLTLAATAGAEETGTSGLRWPSLTPNGEKLVFSYRGDLWIGDVKGASPVQRLTIHEAQDTLGRVSPDGQWIAFSSARNGRYDLFVMPIEGGVPKQVTFHSASEVLCDWSPDGKKLLFASERSGEPVGLDLYEVALDGGTPRRLTFDGGREGTYSPDGKSVVYITGYSNSFWDNYKGSANSDICIADLAGGLPRELTKTSGNERHPFFSADGSKLIFVAEEGGVANFYEMPAAGGEAKAITFFKGADVHRPMPTPARTHVTFERAGRLYVMNLAELPAKDKELPPVPLKVHSDVRNSGLETRTVTSGAQQACISPDGSRIAFTLRGDIWIMPASGGTGRPLTSGPDNDQWPRFSPDGKSIAYFSDKAGNNDIYLLDLASGNTRQLTRDRANDHFHNWGPDGKKIVFCSERSGNKDIWLLDVETGDATALTKHPAADDDPAFSPDGTMITFDSGREGAQAIYTMRVDGSDVRRVTSAAGFLQVPSFSSDGRMIVFEEFSPNGQSAGLFVIGVNGGATMQISRDGQTAHWSPKGDFIYFTADRGRAGNGVFRVPAPKDVTAGEHVPFIGTVTVDLRKELEQLFDECWKSLGEGFYDPKMHGVNWTEMRTKYRAMAIDSECKEEFQNVIRQMLAELGASHLGIWGGERAGNSVSPRVEATGYLGMTFEREASAEGGWKVAAVLPKGPADRAGLRIGDVVTRIGTEVLKGETNLDKVLLGTVGKELALLFKPYSESGLGDERATKITPMGGGELNSYHYRSWIERCTAEVRKGTKPRGELVYLHLNAMNQENLNKFRQAISRWNRDAKVKGLVLDVRNNGGGNIHNELMEVFFAKPLAKFKDRNGRESMQPSLFWDKPVVVLINERSFSDAEVFPYMFKTAGVGPLIGVPTAGGVIGTNNITLSDGSSFRIPRTGFWGLDGTNLEGLGVKPDYLVEESPEDRRKQRDPQIKKAIAVLKDLIASKAAPKPEAKPEAKPDVKTAEPKEPKDYVAPAEPKTEAKTEEKAEEKSEAKAENPIWDAKVGEWVKFRRVLPNGVAIELVLRVKEVTEGEVTIEQQATMPGRDPQESTMTRPRKKELTPPGDLPLESLKPIKFKVGDSEKDCLVMTAKSPKGEVLEWIICPEIPVNGMVAFKRDGQTELEIVEWGFPK